jgi:hypothetical protein
MDGTDPNTLHKNECLMFPILTKAVYESLSNVTEILKVPLKKLLPGYLPIFERLQLKLNSCKQSF